MWIGQNLFGENDTSENKNFSLCICRLVCEICVYEVLYIIKKPLHSRKTPWNACLRYKGVHSLSLLMSDS